MTHQAEDLVRSPGAPGRRRTVLLLAALLSLQHADTAAVGAMATPFEQAFGIGNAQLGTRLLLGIVTAPAGSAVASLAGDVFPAEERSRIYGWVLSGELLGAGAALLVAADLGRALGWSATFLFLAVFSTAIAALLYFFLIEPDRRAALDRQAIPGRETGPGPSLRPGDRARLGGHAMPVFVVAVAELSAPNPALDAARLDAVPAALWGRGEAVRTFVRSMLEGFAPFIFGFVSSALTSGHGVVASQQGSSRARTISRQQSVAA